MLNAKWMDTHPSAQELCRQAEAELAPKWDTQAFAWSEPYCGFVSSDLLPDGWAVSIKLDTKDTAIVDPTCKRTLTLKEYLDG